MNRIRVRSKGNSYNVVVHQKQLRIGRVPEVLRRGEGRGILITDRTVAKLHLESTVGRLSKMGFCVKVIQVPAGERSKTPKRVVQIIEQMLSFEATRKTPVFALGGGVVGDLAGLSASLYMRGVPLVHIPTTLLAQVDSSIGGKTGVDLEQGKNLIGTFWPPKAVWTWLGYLGTLSQRRMREGLSESLKYGYIYDPDVLDLATGLRVDKPLADIDRLESMVLRCANAKAEIVSRDEHEQGLREILNFGHTLGHALERIMGYRQITHGEAVAIGMVLELKLAENLGICSKKIVQDLTERLVKLGLPHQLPDNVSIEELVEAAKHDKKRTSENLRIIGVRCPGETEVMNIRPADLVRHLNACT